MAHQETSSVLVYVRMYAVTERGVVGRQAYHARILFFEECGRILYVFYFS